jgi:DnaJ-class molecular chaperone
MDDDRYILNHPAYEDEPILCPDCDGTGIAESTFVDEETDAIIIEHDPCDTCKGTGIEPDAERDWDVDPY